MPTSDHPALKISVILPTRSPNRPRLSRVLAALVAQTLDPAAWDFVLVDNASEPAIDLPEAETRGLPGFRIAREPRPGLTHARLRGIAGTSGEILVWVDDDNVLAPDYLDIVRDRFAANPRLATAGGRVLPEWEAPPPGWTREFHGLLTLRDHGPEARLCRGDAKASWPEFAPVGAGMAIRRNYAEAYAREIAGDGRRLSFGRIGRRLSSGEDCDIVLAALHAGGDAGYFPELSLRHLIPASRLDRGYLGRLNAGISRSWVAVLDLHGQNPWPAIPAWTVPWRSARSWVRHRAWRSPERWVRWQGSRGQFQGQADLEGSRTGSRPA